MRAVAILCLSLAGLVFLLAAKILITGKDAPEGMAEYSGYVVGTLLIPMVLLIVGVSCWGRADKAEQEAKARAAMVVDAEIVEEPGGNPFADRG